MASHMVAGVNGAAAAAAAASPILGSPGIMQGMAADPGLARHLAKRAMQSPMPLSEVDALIVPAWDAADGTGEEEEHHVEQTKNSKMGMHGQGETGGANDGGPSRQTPKFVRPYLREADDTALLIKLAAAQEGIIQALQRAEVMRVPNDDELRGAVKDVGEEGAGPVDSSCRVDSHGSTPTTAEAGTALEDGAVPQPRLIQHKSPSQF